MTSESLGPRELLTSKKETCACPTCGAKYYGNLEAQSLELRKEVIRKALGEIERFFGLTPSAVETRALRWPEYSNAIGDAGYQYMQRCGGCISSGMFYWHELWDALNAAVYSLEHVRQSPPASVPAIGAPTGSAAPGSAQETTVPSPRFAGLVGETRTPKAGDKCNHCGREWMPAPYGGRSVYHECHTGPAQTSALGIPDDEPKSFAGVATRAEQASETSQMRAEIELLKRRASKAKTFLDGYDSAPGAAQDALNGYYDAELSENGESKR